MSPDKLSPDATSTGYKFLTGANGVPISELYQHLHETAVEIIAAVPDPSQWPHLITYLLASMENQKKGDQAIESTLDNICLLITRRLNKSVW